MLEVLWPSQCGACDAEEQGRLCPACTGQLGAQPLSSLPEGICEGVAGVVYDSPIGVAVQRAKYGRDRGLMQALAATFARGLAPTLAGWPIDVVVGIPSPWTRRIARGFATGAILAHTLARTLGKPCVHALVLQPGKRNAGLSAAGRRANLRGRVRIRRMVEGHVLLVDDVVTTGSTAAACARELLGTAAASVRLAALCEAAAPASRDSRGTFGDVVRPDHQDAPAPPVRAPPAS